MTSELQTPCQPHTPQHRADDPLGAPGASRPHVLHTLRAHGGLAGGVARLGDAALSPLCR